MIPERDAICRNCRMLPSIHHLDYPCCEQPIAPISEEEWRLSGLKPGEPMTADGLRKMMDIAMIDYCRNRMLNSTDFMSLMEG